MLFNSLDYPPPQLEPQIDHILYNIQSNTFEHERRVTDFGKLSAACQLVVRQAGSQRSHLQTIEVLLKPVQRGKSRGGIATTVALCNPQHLIVVCNCRTNARVP